MEAQQSARTETLISNLQDCGPMRNTGRDATREFEDVGHSGDARSRLDTLIIGTVRTSTDDELRASRAGSGATGKSLEELMVSREVVYEWVKDHLNSFKRAGTIGLASVAVFAAAMFLKRYGSRLLPSSRR